jgi:pyridoxamine 5'-phosphate oxidase
MDVADVARDPLRQVAAWLEEARRAGEPMPEAVCVATASAEGMPSARMVLLRGLDTGLVFYTDYGSAKASDLRDNPRAAALLHWLRPRHRQVRASGPVARTTPEESDRYWATRPEGSRRSAVASHQSAVLANRAALERAVAELGDEVPPRPDRWGGYRLTPETVELWEEGRDRLHDRLRYVRDGAGWRVERLAP